MLFLFQKLDNVSNKENTLLAKQENTYAKGLQHLVGSDSSKYDESGQNYKQKESFSIETFVEFHNGNGLVEDRAQVLLVIL